MHPAWFRRHLEELPAAVVGIHDLWDRTEAGEIQGPLGMVTSKEKEKDAELIKEILLQKKNAQDVDSKFAVIILLKRSHIGDPTVEERLISIRRSCQLDSRSGFFALAPFQKNLYEPIVAHYKELYKRAKKRRANPPLRQGNGPHSLVWQARGEIKMGVFAEFRQDVETAIKNYETAHALLVELFSPGTKSSDGKIVLKRGSPRWQEAQTLVDALAFRICRMYFYLENSTSALAQMKRHMDAFKSVYEDRGVYSSHYEFLGWLSKQYRLFGDLVDVSIKHGYKLPSAVATPTSSLSGVSLSGGAGAADYRPFASSFGGQHSAGVNPNTLLQHPGFYYLASSQYAAERRRAYRGHEELHKPKGGKQEDPVEAAAVRQSESEFDHASTTVELLTKSYEHFKKYKHGRMTLYLASEIAQEYFEAAKYEMALKFFDRIAKNYRKEKWHSILGSILRKSLDCARQLQLWTKCVEYLIELLSANIDITEGERASAQQELLDLLSNKHPDQDKAVVLVDMDQVNSFLSCEAVFQHTTGHIAKPIPYQVHVVADPGSPPMPLEMTEMTIEFNTPELRQSILQTLGERRQHDIIDVTHGEWNDDKEARVCSGDLMISPGSSMFVQGTIQPKDPGEVKIMHVSLFLRTEHWDVEMRFNVSERGVRPGCKWLLPIVDDYGTKKFIHLNAALNHSVIKVLRKQPGFELKIEHDAPALLGEQYCVTLLMVNQESEPVNVWLLEAETRLPGTGDAGDTLSLMVKEEDEDKVAPSALITNVDMGQVEPNGTLKRPVFFSAGSLTGDRILRVKVKYQLASAMHAEESYEMETMREIPVILPFQASFDAYPLGPMANGPDLHSYGDLPAGILRKHLVERFTILVQIQSSSPWPIDVDAIQFDLEEDNTAKRLIAASTNPLSEGGLGFQPQTWQAGQVFHANYLVELTFANLATLPATWRAGELEILWKRHMDTSVFADVPLNRTVVRIPPLERSNPDLTVIPEFPAYAHTDVPFTVVYRVWNRGNRIEECAAQLETDGASATSSADAVGFVYAGYKQIRFRVPPMSEYKLKYNLYPVKGGRCKMPRFKVERKRGGMSGKGLGDVLLVTGKEVWVHGEEEERLGENVGVLFIKPKIKFEDD